MKNLKSKLEELKKTMFNCSEKMAKIDDFDTLLNRILQKESPEYYLKITIKELFDRQKN